MDPIGSINIKKDSTFAILLQAQARGWELHYMEQTDLFMRGEHAHARMRTLQLQRDARAWYRFTGESVQALTALDAILMRKDPPFDMDYIYTTYALERAEAAGVPVFNKPQSLRDANEKFFITWFPQCIAPTLIASRGDLLREFWHEHGDIILKPLDGMGGSGIFRIRADDANANVIVETVTAHGTRPAMAQRFVPEIAQGDKRILMIEGEPVPYALARIPKAGESRGNLAAGGRGEGRPLSERDRWICAQVGPTLRARKLLFVGLDVIGDYLTEINVTSPTCIQELDAQYGLNIGAQVIDAVAQRSAR